MGGFVFDLHNTKTHMKNALLELAYKMEVLASRCQGIAFDSQSSNGEFNIVTKLGSRIRLAVDGGANKGEWTQHLLARSPSARVVVVEPNPKNAAQLRQRFKGVIEISVREAALAGKPGHTWFSADEMIGTGAGKTMNQTKSGALEVTACTLREVVDSFGLEAVVDFVKLDIEGDEMEVIIGAKKLFETGRLGIVQVEYNCTWIEKRAYLLDLFQFSRSVNYTILQLTPFGCMHLPCYGIGLEDFRMRNVVLVRGDLLSVLSPFSAAGRARVEERMHSR